ncbi:MAG TPA: multidrug efflux SMR transporter [Ancylobacter sp.]
MAWTYLAIAAIFEVLFAMGMKYSDGFTRLWPTLLTAVSVVAGLTFLALAMKSLPVSVAYPVWTAVGTIGTVIFGAIMLGETLSLSKMLSVATIVIGVAGLKATGA